MAPRPQSAPPRRPQSASGGREASPPRRPQSASGQRDASSGTAQARVGGAKARPQSAKPRSALHPSDRDNRPEREGRQAPRGSERQQLMDRERLEEDLGHLRRNLWALQKQNAVRRHQLLTAEKENVRLDKLVLELLSAIKVPPKLAYDVEIVKSDLQLLVEAKRKSAELRSTVEEREATIRSINRELKVARVGELQQLIQEAKDELDVQKQSWNAFSETHTFIESKKNREKCERTQREIIRLQSELSAAFSKYEVLREDCERARRTISANKNQITKLQTKAEEVKQKEADALKKVRDPKLDQVEEDHRALTEKLEKKYDILHELQRDQQTLLNKFDSKRRVEMQTFDPKFEITKDIATWRLLCGLRHCTDPIVRLPPEHLMTDRTARRVIELLLPGQRAGPILDHLNDVLIDDSGRMIRWIDLCVAIHGSFLFQPRGPLIKEAAALEAVMALAEKCSELRVPESLIKETLRAPPHVALAYFGRLGLDPVYHETLRFVLMNQGPSVLARHLPTWRVFSVLDDVALARRLLKREDPPHFREHHLAELPCTFTDAERTRLLYLFARPGSVPKALHLELPVAYSSRQRLAEMTYHRIPETDDLALGSL